MLFLVMICTDRGHQLLDYVELQVRIFELRELLANVSLWMNCKMNTAREVTLLIYHVYVAYL